MCVTTRSPVDSNVSEEHDAYIFRVYVNRKKM